MKELMTEIKLSTWDRGTVFILTSEGAYPFCRGGRFDDCSAPTMAEVERAVKEFKDEDMSGYHSLPLTNKLVTSAKSVWAIVRPEQTLRSPRRTLTVTMMSCGLFLTTNVIRLVVSCLSLLKVKMV